MTHVKGPAVAGLFYPGSAQILQDTLTRLLAAAKADGSERPLALIAPHAGYQYSGPIAANAYATLLPWAERIHRVLVLAPSHRVPFSGIATSSADLFRTPLGDIPVDRAAVETLESMHGVTRLDAAFAEEHALEVQLPFLQAVLGDFELVPLIVGDAAAEDVSAAIDAVQNDETLVVVSSDLSHYHDYRTCQARDTATSALIEDMQPERIGPYDACGAYPIRGLLQTARRRGWHVRRLDLRNSGDTAGDKSRVVGYGAYEFY